MEVVNKWKLLFPRKPAYVALVAIVLIMLLNLLDFMSGRNFGLSAFYLVPICLVSWRIGRTAGVITAVVSAVSWLYLNGFIYRHPMISCWNFFMLLALYLAVIFLLSSFQKAYTYLLEIVKVLQREIAERKRLENVKLQAERLATVGTMAAQVAHEVRNPLGSISLNLDLLETEFSPSNGHVPAGEEKQALFSDIREEIQRIKRVIEYYLKLARLPKLQSQPLELNEFLREKLAFMGAEFEKANVKLHMGLDPRVRKVNADSGQLWQATLNLIHNSMDAMTGGGELSVGTWLESGQVRVRVSDKGHGMNEEQLRNIFTPFFTTKPCGTGLGLTLVQQIAIEHGGHVECESHPGEGTTFTIFLPLMGKPDEAMHHDKRV